MIFQCPRCDGSAVRTSDLDYRVLIKCVNCGHDLTVREVLALLDREVAA